MVLCILNARTLTLGFRPLTGMVPHIRPIPVGRARFRPLTGMVPSLSGVLPQVQGFRPLTGMVHEQEMADARVRCFRPLTGMVLIPFYVDEVLPGFSPPYGDGTGHSSAGS